MTPPVLETARLILREHRLEDFAVHAAIWADPRVVGPIGIAPRSIEESWLRFLSRIGQWQFMGYGAWAVEERASGRFIGGIGFLHAKRPMELACCDQPEIGWALTPDCHGQGYAREAVAQIVRWGDANLDAPLTWCMIHPQNLVSRKVAERAGYRQTARSAYKDTPVVVLERPRG